jgi:phosphatidylglycerol:prolipoprotein diacylglycerol transferase
MVLAGAERFIVEFFRAKDDRFFGGLTMAQAIAMGIAMGGALWMAKKSKVGPGAPGVMAATA